MAKAWTEGLPLREATDFRMSAGRGVSAGIAEVHAEQLPEDKAAHAT